MKRTLILLSVFGLLLGACGGGGDKKEANGVLKTKLLTVGDLPDGFKRTKAEEKAPGASDDDEETPICKEFDQLDTDFPGERDAEADFERSDAKGSAQVNQQIKRFADEDEADKAFAAFESAFAKCDSFESTDEDGTKTVGSFEKTSFKDVGDDLHPAVMTLTLSDESGQSLTVDGYLLAIRSGKYVVLLMSFGLGNEVTKAELEDVASKSVANL